MTQLCSTKRAEGSVFYSFLGVRRATDPGRRWCASLSLCASKPFRCGDLDRVWRRRAPLDGRRFVPLGQRREMGQPWRERPPCCARGLTPSAPLGVVHATAAPCHWPPKRLVIAPLFHRAVAVTWPRLTAPKGSRFARNHRPPTAVRKESVCR